MGAFTEVTKLEEAIGFVIKIQPIGTLRQVSVSIILMSHDLSQSIRIGYLGEIQTDIIQTER